MRTLDSAIISRIDNEARSELAQEDHRAKVEAAKVRIRARAATRKDALNRFTSAAVIGVSGGGVVGIALGLLGVLCFH